MKFERMRHRIILQKPLDIELNTMGETAPKYENWKTVWANVEPMVGREYQESQKLQAETSYRITIRYLAGLHPNMRVMFRGRAFEVQSILNIGERNEELLLVAIEKVGEEQ